MCIRDRGEAGVFAQLVTSNAVFLQYLSADQLVDLLDTSRYVGDAPTRALEFAKIVREQFDKFPG